MHTEPEEHTGLDPLQLPLTEPELQLVPEQPTEEPVHELPFVPVTDEHVVTFDEVQLKFVVAPECTRLGCALMRSVGVGGPWHAPPAHPYGHVWIKPFPH